MVVHKNGQDGMSRFSLESFMFNDNADSSAAAVLRTAADALYGHGERAEAQELRRLESLCAMGLKVGK